MTRAQQDIAAALKASTEQQARVKRENAAHTPSPWTLQISLGGVHVIGPKPSAIQGLREADARLIAEAPALLEALQAVVDAAGPEAGPEIGRAAEVIARVTGNTP